MSFQQGGECRPIQTSLIGPDLDPVYEGLPIPTVQETTIQQAVVVALPCPLLIDEADNLRVFWQATAHNLTRLTILFLAVF